MSALFGGGRKSHTATGSSRTKHEGLFNPNVGGPELGGTGVSLPSGAGPISGPKVIKDIELVSKALPPPPTPENSAEEIAAAQAAERERNKKGRLSTILTSPRGLIEEPLNISRKTLLGA